MERAQAVGEQAEVADALVCAAEIHFRMGHYEEACARSGEALNLASPEAPTRADALVIQGLCAAETDDPVAA